MGHSFETTAFHDGLIILGAAVALKASPPLAAGTLACGILAIFHGFAHGAELPENASGLAYAGLWAFAPIQTAIVLGCAAVIAGGLVTFGYALRLRARARSGGRSQA